MTSTADGPHVAIAVICERVLQEQDGVMSIVRVVDRFTHTVAAPDAPEQMPQWVLNAWLVVSLKAGAARGRHTVRLVPEAPSGLRMPEVLLPVLFESDDRGANLVVQLNFQVELEGLYWFDVFLEEQLLTRIPLRVVYQRVASSQ